MIKIMSRMTLSFFALLMIGCSTNSKNASGSDESGLVDHGEFVIDDEDSPLFLKYIVQNRTFTIRDIDLVMLPIKSGHFMMGSSYGPPDEVPIHEVEITKAFWLGKTEVTWDQFNKIMRKNSKKSSQRLNFPAENISWHDAMKFCVELTAQEFGAGRLLEGYEYRLPTESEWEYAARSGIAGNYAGNLNDMGWYNGNSDSQVQSVGKKLPNAWGLYDMHGNVWEWCIDWYGKDVYKDLNRVNPVGAVIGNVKVCRGGSWSWTARHCRSANRHWAPPSYCGQNIGFRVALAPVVR